MPVSRRGPEVHTARLTIPGDEGLVLLPAGSSTASNDVDDLTGPCRTISQEELEHAGRGPQPIGAPAHAPPWLMNGRGVPTQAASGQLAIK